MNLQETISRLRELEKNAIPNDDLCYGELYEFPNVDCYYCTKCDAEDRFLEFAHLHKGEYSISIPVSEVTQLLNAIEVMAEALIEIAVYDSQVEDGTRPKMWMKLGYKANQALIKSGWEVNHE